MPIIVQIHKAEKYMQGIAMWPLKIRLYIHEKTNYIWG